MPTRTESAGDLKAASFRAAVAPGEHEKRTGQEDARRASYAEHMVRGQAGEELPI